MRDTSWPFARACSSPASQALTTSRYRGREKIRVTLTLRPEPRTSVMAGSPSTVAGILTIRLRRSTAAASSRAWATVPAVSRASRGSTSIET